MTDPRDKVRLRTQKELSEQFEGLLFLSRALNDCDVKWFLTNGTLLGAVRANDFISWDWDVGVTVMTELARPRRKRIIQELLSAGFRILKTDFSRANFKIVAGGFGTKYEIVGLRRKGRKLRARRMMHLSASLFEAEESVYLRGQAFPAPSPATQYLREVYGDWELPKRTAIKEEYLTPRANRKPSAFSKVFKRVRGIITGCS